MQIYPYSAISDTLTRDIEELDRLVHRIKTQLQTPQKNKDVLLHWRAIRGILKGKITEDSLTYQRRVRSESERDWFMLVLDTNIDSMIAELTADIRRVTKLKLIDSAIAATVLSMRAKLVTRDTDFTRVKDIEIVLWWVDLK